MKAAAAIVALILLAIANMIAAKEVHAGDTSDATMLTLYADVVACAAGLLVAVRRAVDARAAELAARAARLTAGE